ncbi:MAG: 50S ribosomal protein L7/L12 [Planctomycetota bacterium]|nr:50S ribosomal protein L7/L12 [Planctomycetota bacterium]
MSEEETTAEASFDAKISKLGDEIAGLTLKEAVDLTDYMKATYGIEPAAGGAVMVAGGGDGGGGGAEEAQTEFDVILEGAGDKKIQVIKAVREITGLGLKEAKEMVDNCPKPVKEKASQEEAEEMKTKLEEAGAVVNLK